MVSWRVSYYDFDYDNRKRILRNEKEDIKTTEKLIKSGKKHYRQHWISAIPIGIAYISS